MAYSLKKKRMKSCTIVVVVTGASGTSKAGKKVLLGLASGVTIGTIGARALVKMASAASVAGS